MGYSSDIISALPGVVFSWAGGATEEEDTVQGLTSATFTPSSPSSEISSPEVAADDSASTLPDRLVVKQVMYLKIQGRVLSSFLVDPQKCPPAALVAAQYSDYFNM